MLRNPRQCWFLLLNRHRLREIARLIHIRPLHQRRVIREQLHGDGVDDGRELSGVAGRADDVYAFGFGEVAVQIGEDE